MAHGFRIVLLEGLKMKRDKIIAVISNDEEGWELTFTDIDYLC